MPPPLSFPPIKKLGLVLLSSDKLALKKLLGEMTDFRTEVGNRQEEPRASCSTRN